jgi:hypothetical protein
VRGSPSVIGAAVLAWGILSAVPAVCATDSPGADTYGNIKGEHAASGEDALLQLWPFRLNQNLALSAVDESSADSSASDDEADKLAKQLSNPVASLIPADSFPRINQI